MLFAGVASSRFTCKAQVVRCVFISLYIILLLKLLGGENLDDAASAINDYINIRKIHCHKYYRSQFALDE